MIELLVVIAIISLLVSILLPSLQKAKSLAQTVACLSNCRSIGSAFAMYLNEEAGSFPGYSSPTSGYAISWNVAFVKKGYIADYTFFDCPTEMGTNITEFSDVPKDWSARVFMSEYGYNFMSLGMKNSYMYGLPAHDFIPAKESDLANPAETICTVDSADSRSSGAYYGRRGYYVVCAWFDWNSYIGMPAARHNQSVNIQWADGHCETTASMPELPEDPSSYDPGNNPYYFSPLSKGATSPNVTDNYWSRY